MIYLAGPVFALAQRRFNKELAGELERLCPSLQVFLPQRYDKEFQNASDHSRKVFARLMGASTDAISSSPFWMDQMPARARVSRWAARGRGKKMIGVTTDFRGSEDHGLNLMLSNACSALVTEQSTTSSRGRRAEKIMKVVTAGKSLPRNEQARVPYCHERATGQDGPAARRPAAPFRGGTDAPGVDAGGFGSDRMRLRGRPIRPVPAGDSCT